MRLRLIQLGQGIHIGLFSQQIGFSLAFVDIDELAKITDTFHIGFRIPQRVHTDFEPLEALIRHHHAKFDPATWKLGSQLGQTLEKERSIVGMNDFRAFYRIPCIRNPDIPVEKIVIFL